MHPHDQRPALRPIQGMWDATTTGVRTLDYSFNGQVVAMRSSAGVMYLRAGSLVTRLHYGENNQPFWFQISWVQQVRIDAHTGFMYHGITARRWSIRRLLCSLTRVLSPTVRLLPWST
jgi:hypothetical protein